MISDLHKVISIRLISICCFLDWLTFFFHIHILYFLAVKDLDCNFVASQCMFSNFDLTKWANPKSFPELVVPQEGIHGSTILDCSIHFLQIFVIRTKSQISEERTNHKPETRLLYVKWFQFSFSKLCLTSNDYKGNHSGKIKAMSLLMDEFRINVFGKTCIFALPAVGKTDSDTKTAQTITKFKTFWNNQIRIRINKQSWSKIALFYLFLFLRIQIKHQTANSNLKTSHPIKNWNRKRGNS